jgi:hypothetical protein
MAPARAIVAACPLVRPSAVLWAAVSAFLLVFLLGFLSGCQNFPDPPVTFVSGLRVLAIEADPPQVAAGGSTTVTLLAVDTTGATPSATWNQCSRPPLAGEAVNPDCVTHQTAPYLQPIGQGSTITTTMPEVTAESLGEPDATGGVYLPLVVEVSDGTDALTAVYRLRLGNAAPANANPTIASVYTVDAAGAMSPLDEAATPVVHAGDALTLGVTFAPGSAETYLGPDGTATTEVLTTSWFCTAGDLSVEKTSEIQPQTVLRLDQRLPVAQSQIDLYAVARDERGGTDYAHRAFQLQ